MFFRLLFCNVDTSGVKPVAAFFALNHKRTRIKTIGCLCVKPVLPLFCCRILGCPLFEEGVHPSLLLFFRQKKEYRYVCCVFHFKKYFFYITLRHVSNLVKIVTCSGVQDILAQFIAISLSLCNCVLDWSRFQWNLCLFSLDFLSHTTTTHAFRKRLFLVVCQSIGRIYSSIRIPHKSCN